MKEYTEIQQDIETTLENLASIQNKDYGSLDEETRGMAHKYAMRQIMPSLLLVIAAVAGTVLGLLMILSLEFLGR